MSRNSRNTNGRGMNRNTGRSRQTGPLSATAGTPGWQTVKAATCKRGSVGSGMRYYSRSHYAAVGAASLPRRAGRRY